jgi:hypothetical protein
MPAPLALVAAPTPKRLEQVLCGPPGGADERNHCAPVIKKHPAGTTADTTGSSSPTPPTSPASLSGRRASRLHAVVRTMPRLASAREPSSRARPGPGRCLERKRPSSTTLRRGGPCAASAGQSLPSPRGRSSRSTTAGGRASRWLSTSRAAASEGCSFRSSSAASHKDSYRPRQPQPDQQPTTVTA